MTPRKFAVSGDKLQEAMDKCTVEAKESEKLTRKVVNALQKSSDTTIQSIEKAISDIKKKDKKTKNSLAEQLNSLRNYLEYLPSGLNSGINMLSKDKDSFSITLFGKSKVGKSTLYEVLIKGNGDSMGKGDQRTTRRVYSYMNKGLKITDVPGIAAWGGEEDEKRAFATAEKSNLMLFLASEPIGDEEAECLSRLVNIGKPVICLINVKARVGDVNNKEDFEDFEDLLEKGFDPKRLRGLKDQIIEYGKKYKQDWSKIRFAESHLLAAFLAQQNSGEMQEKLYKLSNFDAVKKLMIDEVLYNGPFYKLKSYIDIVAVDLTNALRVLFAASERNFMMWKILDEQYTKLGGWSRKFEKEANNEIKQFIRGIQEELNKERDAFTEEYYNASKESKNEAWKEVVESLKIESRGNQLLQALGKKRSDRLEKAYRQVQAELKFSPNGLDVNDRLDIAGYGDAGINAATGVAAWKAGAATWTAASSAGLGSMASAAAATGVGACVIAAGWLAAVIWEAIFDDSEEQKEELRKALDENIGDIINRLRQGMMSNFKNKIMKNIKQALLNMSARRSLFHKLSNGQLRVAKAFNKELQKLNMELVKKAFLYKKLNGLGYIDKIGRVPGNTLILAFKKHRIISKKSAEELSSLLQEKIRIITDDDDIQSVSAQIIGKGCKIEELRKGTTVVCIGQKRKGDISTFNNKVEMAQQITETLMLPKL